MPLVGREHRPPSLGIVRKAAGREDDAAARPNLRFTLGGAQHGPADAAVCLKKTHGRRGGAKIDAEIGSGPYESPHQGEAVAKLHPSPVQGEVDQVPAEAARHMDQGTGRSGHVHEGRKVRPGLDRHAHEGRLAHRPAQEPDERAQRPCIVGGGDDRAPAGPGARDVAVGVGNRGAALEPERGLLVEEGHHARRGIEEGIDPLLVEIVAEHVGR
jgi:hypothetical protein